MKEIKGKEQKKKQNFYLYEECFYLFLHSIQQDEEEEEI